jgi:hypothetical protein
VEGWQNQKAYNRVPFPTPLYTITEVQKCPLSGAKQSLFRLIFHNVGSAKPLCRRKAKMSALSKVGMSVFDLFTGFGGWGSDGCGADEQARAENQADAPPAGAAAAAIPASTQRRPRLRQKLPSDILTLQKSRHLNLVATAASGAKRTLAKTLTSANCGHFGGRQPLYRRRHKRLLGYRLATAWTSGA